MTKVRGANGASGRHGSVRRTRLIVPASAKRPASPKRDTGYGLAGARGALPPLSPNDNHIEPRKLTPHAVRRDRGTPRSRARARQARSPSDRPADRVLRRRSEVGAQPRLMRIEIDDPHAREPKCQGASAGGIPRAESLLTASA